MNNTLSLYDYNLSQLSLNLYQFDKFKDIEYLIIKKLNIDINPRHANLPITLKKILLINPRYHNDIIDIYRIEDIVYNFKLPFGCKLYIRSYIEDNDVFTHHCKIAYYVDDKLTTHNITKNNFGLQDVSNKFTDIYNEIKSNM